MTPNFQWCTLFDPLLEIGKYRYKCARGGRAGMKTEHFGAGLLSIGERYKTRILCTREIQNTIDDSVHQTLADIITAKELDYEILKNRICHRKTGTEFIFKGLSKMTAQSLKSLANVDICWGEEAQAFSQKSIDVLIPTIRKKGSELWFTWNPGREDDPIEEMFVTQSRPKTWLLTVNYNQNPWFNDLPLKDEMEFCKKNNYSKYRHIWLGEPITDYDTLVYRFDRQKNCIDWELKYNEGFETVTSWDFGTTDDTAIIFYQIRPTTENEFGYWIDVFDEYVNNNKDDAHYREVVDSKRYLIDRHYCDPAGSGRQSDLSSWIDKLQKNPFTGQIDWHFEYSNYYRGKVQMMTDRANDIIPYVRYNPHKTPHFHKMAFHWQYRTDKDGKIVLPPKPEHDEFSHMGTSFYYFAICRFPPLANQKVRILQ